MAGPTTMRTGSSGRAAARSRSRGGSRVLGFRAVMISVRETVSRLALAVIADADDDVRDASTSVWEEDVRITWAVMNAALPTSEAANRRGISFMARVREICTETCADSQPIRVCF